MRADFWDVVRIGEQVAHEEIRGRTGYVQGIGEEEGNPRRGLSVWVYDLEEGWCVEEEDLILLGYKDEIARADYGRRERPTIRVGVDPETGKGFLSD